MKDRYLILIILMAFTIQCLSQFETDRGGIIQADSTSKSIALVFTGDEFADGGNIIFKSLKQNKVKASFFLTGNFYANHKCNSIIRKLKKDNHYLGAHSDKHLLYNDWSDRSLTLVSKDSFLFDLNENYRKMRKFGIDKKDATFYMPPYEWYNDTISTWANEYGVRIVNFTPGTHSNADYTYPEMGDKYRTTEWIYDKIWTYENNHTLNGFILLIHIGTDPRRKDKLYHKLGELIVALKKKGYEFKRIDLLLHQ